MRLARKKWKLENPTFKSIPGTPRKVAKPHRKRERDLQTKYGITLEQYTEMYNSQKGLCKICDGFMEVLRVDHCHSTSKVRGLLCHKCNVGLGHFNDSIELLSKATLYLKGD